MSKAYITITGINHYYGAEFLKPKTRIRLIKEPDNKVDHEAIRAEIEGLGKIGYVANSPWTVLGESISAGRLYDKIGDTATAKVVFVLPKGIICKIKSLQSDQPIDTSNLGDAADSFKDYEEEEEFIDMEDDEEA